MSPEGRNGTLYPVLTKLNTMKHMINKMKSLTFGDFITYGAMVFVIYASIHTLLFVLSR
jgi:hypothetical protein